MRAVQAGIATANRSTANSSGLLDKAPPDGGYPGTGPARPSRPRDADRHGAPLVGHAQADPPAARLASERADSPREVYDAFAQGHQAGTR
jgi:hypothetical protein